MDQDPDDDLAVTVEPVYAPPVITIHLPMAVDRVCALLRTASELWPDCYAYPGEDDTELHIIPKE